MELEATLPSNCDAILFTKEIKLNLRLKDSVCHSLSNAFVN